MLNHVLLHQTVIGQEARQQLQLAGEKKPDIVIACAGGGSNFAGLAFPFTLDKINGADIRIIPVEPAACPTMTKAPFVYDYGDTAGMTPLLPMFSLGHSFVPAPIHAGGLRYHGIAPLISQAIIEGLLEPRSIDQVRCYQSAMTWAQTEGPICAPETSHAIACVIDEALKAKEEGKEKVILFCYSGHGLMDLAGYEKFMTGQLAEVGFSDEEMRRNLKPLEKLPKPAANKTGKW